MDFFRAQGELDGRDPAEIRDTNYVESEILDSLAIVEMITGLEDRFGIRLEPEEMQDPRFCTIAGLSEIVEEARARA